MQSNNGWYSVFDTEHKPESGKEYLCLGLLEYAFQEENPLSDPDYRVYYVATWFDAGDTVYDETPNPEENDSVFGKERVVEQDGFYIQVPHGCKGSTPSGPFAGIKLPEYSVYMVWERLGNHGEVIDGLICWKELDTPEFID